MSEPGTDSVDRALAHWASPVPATLKQQFQQYLCRNLRRRLLAVHIAAHITFLCYWLVDITLIPDIRWQSLIVRAVAVAVSLPLVVLLIRRSYNMRLLDMILPTLTVIATLAWSWVLLQSDSPHIDRYIYISTVFQIIANFNVYVSFAAAVCSTLLVAAMSFYAASTISTGGAEAFAIVYFPVMVFCLYISWTNTVSTRRQFLRSVKDETVRNELAAANESLQVLAGRDALTGIANRRQVDVTLAEHWRRYRQQQVPFAVMIADVDYFKAYNDHYGHLPGDACLVLVAQILTETLRDGEWFVGRYGGEEFAILIAKADTKALQAISERIVENIHNHKIEHLSRPDEFDVVTISVGGALTDESTASAEDLLDRADTALYAAKRGGRNRAILSDPSRKDERSDLPYGKQRTAISAVQHLDKMHHLQWPLATAEQSTELN